MSEGKQNFTLLIVSFILFFIIVNLALMTIQSRDVDSDTKEIKQKLDTIERRLTEKETVLDENIEKLKRILDLSEDVPKESTEQK